jgi:hypothetical protein
MNKEFLQFLSEARLAKYSLEGDPIDKVIERYQWNVRLAEAMMPALGYVEIGLRNHMNLLIGQIYGDRWLLNPPRELRLRQNDLDKIRAIHNELRHERHGDPTNDDVVSRMNFGFWSSLFQKQYDSVLWQNYHGLTVVFPHLGKMERSRQQISPKLQLVRFARNCIAHHEPIWDLQPDIKIIHDTCLELVRAMSLGVAAALEKAVDRFDGVYAEGRHLLKQTQEEHAAKIFNPLDD